MTAILSKLFVKNYRDTKNPAVRTAYGTMVSIVGILLNLLLFAGKFTVGFLFSAVSIQADAFNNLSDAGSQLISLVCFRIAAKPADRHHPYGHARIEYVASMIVSLLILLISYELFSDSLAKLLSGEGRSEFSLITLAVLVVSIGAKLWLSLFNRTIGRKIDSSVMRATAADSLSDAGATLAVLVSAIIAHFFDLPFDLDAAMGILVSVLIFIAGIKILLEAKDAILGEAPADEIIEEIKEAVKPYPEALGIHDLAVHNYGPGRIYASLHIEVDGSGDIFLLHDLIDNIEKQLRDDGIEATIHMDPIVTNDETVDRLRLLAAEAAKKVDPSLKIHDFRCVVGESHTNLIFDLVVPFEKKESNEEIGALVTKEIRRSDPHYNTVLHIERE